MADGNPNHAIHTRFRIECPAELVGITNLQRLNDAAEVAQNVRTFIQPVFDKQGFSVARGLFGVPARRGAICLCFEQE